MTDQTRRHTPFEDDLAERMRDPEFAAAFEAERDAIAAGARGLGDPVEDGVDPAGDVVYDESRAADEPGGGTVAASYLVRVTIRATRREAAAVATRVPTVSEMGGLVSAAVDEYARLRGLRVSATARAERVDR